MKISITRQLWALSFGFFIFMIVNSVGSFLSSRALLGQVDNAVNTQMVAIRNMTLADMMHDGIRGVVAEALIAANEKNSSELGLLITEADEKSNNFSKYLAVLETLKLSPETKSAIIETETLKGTYITQAKSIVKTAKEAGYSQGLIQLPKFKETFFKLEEKMEYLGDLIEKDAKPDLASGEFYLNLNILIAISSLLIGCTSTVWILTRLIRELKSFILRMHEAGTHVSQTSTKMSFTSQESANTAGLSAASLQETTASVEELNSMVKINSDNAQSASALAEQTRGEVTSGMHEMQTLVKVIADLSTSSKKMEDIINVIDDIAFQTNLLALNAAVEAARAGEQGKGFAVVADAVRSLAQRSSIAAKDISVMIQANVEKITVGNGITTRSGESLEKMVAEITRVSQINAEIARASNEQSVALSQITLAMNSLDKSTQTNALASEDLSFASKEMQDQAQQMAALVVSFEQIALGNNAKAGNTKAVNVTSYSTN